MKMSRDRGSQICSWSGRVSKFCSRHAANYNFLTGGGAMCERKERHMPTLCFFSGSKSYSYGKGRFLIIPRCCLVRRHLVGVRRKV